MNNIIAKTEHHVLSFFNANLKGVFLYHNIAHTQRVVRQAMVLAEIEQLEEKTRQKLTIAAWFHDTGYLIFPENHEEESVRIATEFLTKLGVEDFIADVSEAIRATKLGEKPATKIGMLLKDADCSHVGSENYSEYSELLRKELELSKDKTFTDEEWLQNNINFLVHKHQFYSVGAAKLWGTQKSKNIAVQLKTQKKLDRLKNKSIQKTEQAISVKKVKEAPGRGIETMFRVALRNHITLSDIADTKANILLSVNAIIISMTISTLIPKLDNPSNTYLLVPSVIFIFFTMISIVLSILATRPNVTQGKFTKEDVAAKKVNLIFFGNFHKMSLTEFEWAMDEMLKDRDYLYGSLTKDLYFLGLVLNRKYSLLRTTYMVFMIGLIVSVIAFVVAFYLQSSAAHAI